MLRKSPFKINKLFIKSNPPIKSVNCKGMLNEKIMHKRIVAATRSINPSIFTSTMISSILSVLKT